MTAEEVDEIAIALPSLRSLVEIKVEELFGVFSYNLIANHDPNKLMVLYGDNGSGKTTLLECMYRLLSPAMDSGHRGYLGRTQFRQFGVRFSGGWTIMLDRPESTKGDYTLSFTEPGKLEPTVTEYNAEKKQLADNGAEYGAFLRRLNVEVYFLRADRTLVTDSASQARRTARNVRVHSDVARFNEWILTKEKDQEEGHSLERAISKTNDYLRRRASTAANIGGKSANSIYDDVVKSISGPAMNLGLPMETPKERLIERLTNLSERSKEFARYSLIPPLNAQDMISSINQAPKDRLDMIGSVLEPHLASISARLDALDSTRKLIASLVEDINSFFNNKRLRFNVSSGVQIIASDGTTLSPDLLSSGEKHLLLMFCHTVVAHGKRTLFIIDEPELSLNVKWQHNIADKLLDIVKDSPMQFVFATHSIELLSQHLDQVVKLVPTALSNRSEARTEI